MLHGFPLPSFFRQMFASPEIKTEIVPSETTIQLIAELQRSNSIREINLQNVITSIADLMLILQNSQISHWHEIIFSQLGSNYLQQLIRTKEHLLLLLSLHTTEFNSFEMLIELLEKEWLQNLIYSFDSLKEILEKAQFSGQPIIKKCEASWLRMQVTNCAELSAILGSAENYTGNLLLKKLGQEWVRSQVQQPRDLEILLSANPYIATTLSKLLGKTRVNILICDSDEFKSLKAPHNGKALLTCKFGGVGLSKSCIDEKLWKNICHKIRTLREQLNTSPQIYLSPIRRDKLTALEEIAYEINEGKISNSNVEHAKKAHPYYAWSLLKSSEVKEIMDAVEDQASKTKPPAVTRRNDRGFA